MREKLICYLDGNSLCITKEKFVNLQESLAVFIELNDEQLKELEKME